MPVDASEVPEAEIPSTVEVDRHKLAALQAAQKELVVTQKVLAVVTERLLAATKASSVIITDAVFEKAPSLHAWREDPQARVVVTIQR